jgi:hypothetical protein
MVVLAMSRPEIDRMHVLRDVMAERITVHEAAPLVQIGTDFSQSTREPLRSIRAWVSRAARLGPPTWSDERISLRPLPRIFVEAHLKSLKR